MTQEQYGMWLCSIEGIGSQTIRKLINRFGTPEEVYTRTEEQLKEAEIGDRERKLLINGKRQFHYRAMKQKISSYDMDVISYFSERYPEKLRHIPDFPKRLYWRGKLPREELQIAIVGARNCSHYGREMARRFAYELSGSEIGVISGMARGIDGAGQRGALNAGGMTYGILGCGVDICYPGEHRGLYQDLIKKGGVISEQSPGSPPLARYFPARNRIISGMADIVLVIEAKEKSGSLITADQALEQGKEVYALPGPVTSLLSQGCHRLIAQGAGILLSPEDLMETMGICLSKSRQNKSSEKKVLESPENMVYSCVGLFPKGLQELAQETKLAPEILMEELITLELQGFVKEISKNYYVKMR